MKPTTEMTLSELFTKLETDMENLAGVERQLKTLLSNKQVIVSQIDAAQQAIDNHLSKIKANPPWETTWNRAARKHNHEDPF